MRPPLPLRCSLFPPVLLAVAALVNSCGESEPVVTMPIETVVVSLVSTESAWEVLEEHEDAPVSAETLAPQKKQLPGAGPLPALQLTPPARVRLRLGRMPAGVELRFAVGFDRSAYEGEEAGRVRFTVSGSSGKLFAHDLPFGELVATKERTWTPASILLEGLDELLLSTELVEGKGAPPAAFASLQVITTTERPRERASRERPNVVLILVDTLRHDRLSCYGGREGLTPAADALARRGVLFESAYATSPWTWPSTASILTSLSTAEHGVVGHGACYLSQDLDTLAEALQREGWTTGAFSANPLIDTDKEFNQGFETFRGMRWATAGKLVGAGLDWLRANGGWRFFLYLHLTDPHEYKPGDRFREQWALDEPEGFQRQEWQQHLVDKILKGDHDAERLAECTAYMSSVYDASLADLDVSLAKLTAELEQLGVAENTIVLLTSDHGEEFLEHGNLYHGSHLHRELTGVPLIVAGAGVPEGVVVEERVENRFIPPTVLRLVGLEPEGNLVGCDLMDLEEVRRAEREAVFQSTTRGLWLRDGEEPLRNLTIHGLRLGEHLFMWAPDCPDGGEVRALFDLEVDPEGLRDLSGSSGEVCDRYERMIESWLERSEKVRPHVLDGGESALELMLQLGYVSKER